jgi:hypothetical protein
VACTWGVVNHSGLVDVGDGVFKVDKLGAEGVLVVGRRTHVGLAEHLADDLRHAAVVRKRDGGFMFGGGCWSKGRCWSLVE